MWNTSEPTHGALAFIVFTTFPNMQSIWQTTLWNLARCSTFCGFRENGGTHEVAVYLFMYLIGISASVKVNQSNLLLK